MSSLGLKRAVSNAVYQNLRDEIPDLQSQIDSNKSDITNLQNQINQVGTTDFYKTLIFRQHYTQGLRFSSQADCDSFNSTIDNPETSSQFSIIGSTEDIKGDFNTYVYMINIVSYGAVTKDSTTYTIDTAIPGKNTVVISQGYSPIWSAYNNRGTDATIVHSSGMFRSSVLTGGLKHSNEVPTRFGYDFMFGATKSLERYYGIGYMQSFTDFNDGVNGGEYDYFKIQSTRVDEDKESGIEYKNALVEVFQISKTNYERASHIGSDTISTQITGTCIFNLNYIV